MIRRALYSPRLPRRIAEATTELLALAAAAGAVTAACLWPPAF